MVELSIIDGGNESDERLARSSRTGGHMVISSRILFLDTRYRGYVHVILTIAPNI